MKKLITLTCLVIAAIASKGQTTKTVTPSKDTLIQTITPATATIQPATVSNAFKAYKAPSTIPPVIPPVITPPPVTTPTKYKLVSSQVFSGQSNFNIQGDSCDVKNQNQVILNLNNCHHVDISNNYFANSANVVILLTSCDDIKIHNNILKHGVSIVRCIDCTGGGIVVENNQMEDPTGPVQPNGWGNFVQFDNVQTASLQNSISFNTMKTNPGVGLKEDCISIYKSNGTASLPIKIWNNKIQGGSLAPNGGGIMLGDNGGSYQDAENNILNNPGQYGMAIAGGDHNTINNNQVFGPKTTVSNVGVYVWGQAGAKVSNATVSNNQVNWTNSGGSSNPDWLASGEATPAGWSTNNWKSTITSAITSL